LVCCRQRVDKSLSSSVELTDAAEAVLREQTAAAKSQLDALTQELTTERQQHAARRARSESLATVKARAEAQATIQFDQAERLKRLETDLNQTRSTAAAAKTPPRPCKHSTPN
jgi:hypothetical protein